MEHVDPAKREFMVEYDRRYPPRPRLAGRLAQRDPDRRAGADPGDPRRVPAGRRGRRRPAADPARGRDGLLDGRAAARARHGDRRHRARWRPSPVAATAPKTSSARRTSPIAARWRSTTRALFTSLRETRDDLGAILEGVADAVTAQAADGRLVYANDAAVRLLGLASADEMLAAAPGEIRANYEMLTEDGRPLTYEELPGRQALRGERPAADDGPVPVARRGGRPLVAHPVHPGARRERPRSPRDQRHRGHHRAQARRARRSGSWPRRAACSPARSTCRRRSRTVARARRARRSPTGARSTSRPATASNASRSPTSTRRRSSSRAEMQERYPPDPRTNTGVYGVLRHGIAELYPEITDEMLVAGARDEEHLEIARSVGLRSAMLVPMRLRDRVLGVLSFVIGRVGSPVRRAGPAARRGPGAARRRGGRERAAVRDRVGDRRDAAVVVAPARAAGHPGDPDRRRLPAGGTRPRGRRGLL